jgi:hypothetical protein
MIDLLIEITPEFQRGWDAALLAACHWHELHNGASSVLPKSYRKVGNLTALMRSSSDAMSNCAPRSHLERE